MKSTYQIVDNTKLRANRQGCALRYNVDGGPFESNASYTNVQQIEAATIANASRVSFVEGFFLPQVGSSGTFGRTQRLQSRRLGIRRLQTYLSMSSTMRCTVRRHELIPKMAYPKTFRSTS